MLLARAGLWILDQRRRLIREDQFFLTRESMTHVEASQILRYAL